MINQKTSEQIKQRMKYLYSSKSFVELHDFTNKVWFSKEDVIDSLRIAGQCLSFYFGVKCNNKDCKNSLCPLASDLTVGDLSKKDKALGRKIIKKAMKKFEEKLWMRTNS